MYKKFALILAVLFAVVSISACGESKPKVPFAEDKPVAGATFTPEPTPPAVDAEPAPVVKTTGPPIEIDPSNGNPWWNFVSGDFKVNAQVNDGVIVVYMGSSTSQGRYWQGTFDESKIDKNGESVTSIANKKVLSHSLFGSTEDTLKFSFKDDYLVFDVCAQGTCKTVHLLH